MINTIEKWHPSGNWLKDFILGGQDGLVNVLGVILGVNAAGGSHTILIAASFAAAFAEAISMAAVAYTSNLAQKDYYEKEKNREYQEIETAPEQEKEEIRQIYISKGFSGELLEKVVETLTRNKEVWVNNMLTDELGLQPISTRGIWQSSGLVGISAVIGSLVPVIPYLILPSNISTIVSLLISCIALFLVGAYKAKMSIGIWWKSGLQMLLIGMGAAIIGFLTGRFFGAL